VIERATALLVSLRRLTVMLRTVAERLGSRSSEMVVARFAEHNRRSPASRQQSLFDLRQDFFAEEIELSWIRVGQADDQGVEAFR
jgi:hypothetical protein